MWSRILGTCTRTAIACFVCLYSYRHTLNDDDDVRGDCDNDVHADIVEVEVVTSVAFSFKQQILGQIPQKQKKCV